MNWLETAQRTLKEQSLAGWLIYDFRGSNPLAAKFLDFGDSFLSRRIFAFVPADGTPVILVSVLEAGSLRAEGFEVRAYTGRASLEAQLSDMLPAGPVAMEISPKGDIPYLSTVDAGTAEFVAGLLESKGGSLVSSAHLLQAFGAWSPEQIASHKRAATATMDVLEEAWVFLRDQTSAGQEVRETDVQNVIADGFTQRGLIFGHGAIVGFGPNGGDPHYVPREGADRALQPGDPVLIDLFARFPGEGDPYGDVTWMGVYGDPTPEFMQVWELVRDARKVGVRTLREAVDEGRWPEGCEVDRAVRSFLTDAGYGEAFVHRTGHSLGSKHTHGDAVHLDDFETHDTRLVTPGIGVTIEPGVYLPAFGVRSELNVVMTESGPEVTTGEQEDLVRIPLGPHHS